MEKWRERETELLYPHHLRKLDLVPRWRSWVCVLQSLHCDIPTATNSKQKKPKGLDLSNLSALNVFSPPSAAGFTEQRFHFLIPETNSSSGSRRSEVTRPEAETYPGLPQR